MRTGKLTQLMALAFTAFILVTGCSKNNSSPNSSSPTSVTNGDMVLTPAGYMAKSNVHFIEPGFGIRVQDGRLQKVELKSGRMAEDFGEVRIGETHSNSSPLAGTRTDNRLPEVEGWIAYTYWSNPTTTSPITSFTTDWTVPSVPSKKGSQTIFLFNGMQDGTTASSYIIQPVLQWGPSAAGGGKYWAITNWYVSSSQAFFGSLVEVSTGTALTGVMTETSASGSSYNYNSSFTGYPTTTLNATGVPQAFWAAETLESYGVTNTSTEYPPNVDLAMTGIDILEGSTHPSISWTTAQASSGAAQKAVVVSNSSSDGQVDIYFRK
jgi:hypothetical protein